MKVLLLLQRSIFKHLFVNIYLFIKRRHKSRIALCVFIFLLFTGKPRQCGYLRPDLCLQHWAKGRWAGNAHWTFRLCPVQQPELTVPNGLSETVNCPKLPKKRPPKGEKNPRGRGCEESTPKGGRRRRLRPLEGRQGCERHGDAVSHAFTGERPTVARQRAHSRWISFQVCVIKQAFRLSVSWWTWALCHVHGPPGEARADGTAHLRANLFFFNAVLII